MWQCLEILALHSWALRSQAFIRASRSKSVINAISWGFVPSHDFSKEFCWAPWVQGLIRGVFVTDVHKAVPVPGPAGAGMWHSSARGIAGHVPAREGVLSPGTPEVGAGTAAPGDWDGMGWDGGIGLWDTDFG